MRPYGRARRIVAPLTAIALIVSLASTASGQQAEPDDLRVADAPLERLGTIHGDPAKAPRTADGRVPVVVDLEAEAIASYDGGVPGLAATSPRARGAKSLDLRSRAARDYGNYLRGTQDTFTQRLGQRVRDAKVTGRLDIVVGGVTALVRPDDIGAIASIPGVRAVYVDQPEQLLTNVSAEHIGAPAVWDQLGGQADAGEGVVVGVLDSGIWPEHPSVADPDPAGNAYPAPPAPVSGTRACEFSGGANPGSAFACNNKLIGADRFMATYDAVFGLLPTEFTTARDDNGHGTHTLTTAAGNGGVEATMFGTPRGTITGIAPRAHVIAYKVCGNQGCFPTDSVGAVQEAIRDGVDVINFSISGGANPYGDAVELAFLDAYNAGVFVSASAGNSGPGLNTTDHRGPWTMTVAASTSPRHFLTDITLTASNGDTLVLEGASITPPSETPKPVVLATAAGSNALCVTPIPANSLTNQIVACQAGPNRTLKSRNVLDGGGDGMLLYNATPAEVLTDNHWLPTVHVGAGPAFLAFMASHSGVTATFSQGTAEAVQPDRVTYFSSRGGPGQTLGVSKPDVTAPGIQILAGATPVTATNAGGPSELFQSIAGTSMSSPHVAGSGALLAALHPDWTPGQIKSALMTTARTAGVTKSDGSAPFDAFDAGSGRVDLGAAASPGIVFDVAGADYLAHAADLQNTNYPSVFYPDFPGVGSVSRTARDTLGVSTAWRLTTTSPADFEISVPKSITVPPNGSASFDIGLDASNVPVGQTRFGTITLRQSKGGTRVLHMPVTVVRGQATIAITKACTPTELSEGDVTACNITLTNPTFNDATYTVTDKLPPQLKLDPASVTGATVVGIDTVTASGTIAAAQPPNVTIAPGSSAAGGYLPLSAFGIAPISGVGDDTITNFNVPAFRFGGELWSQLGVSSNGYLVVGGGAGADNSINNQNFPNPARPNNTLAPFWTDLNPAAAGALRIATLTDGANTWIVVDWAGVREFSTAGNLHSFEVWIGITGDVSPGEDISYAFGPNTGNGDGGFLSVGAENRFGNRGGTIYFNGTGTLPANGTELRVTSTAGVPSSLAISFEARAGDDLGPWTNCVTLVSSAFAGTSYSCVNGSIVP